jgi:hypothetical protein
VEPTEEMVKQGWLELDGWGPNQKHEAIAAYQAMIAAAPNTEPDELARLDIGLAKAIAQFGGIEDIMETAMNIHHVKKERRHHVKRVLECAFDLLLEHHPTDPNLVRVKEQGDE